MKNVYLQSTAGQSPVIGEVGTSQAREFAGSLSDTRYHEKFGLCGIMPTHASVGVLESPVI